MGLAIYAQAVGHQRLRMVADDRDASFVRLCLSAPLGSIRRGVMPHGDTMFNSWQTERLIEELEALPAGRPAVIDEILEVAWLALKKAGYVYIIGD
jgi:hypothetical protein